MNSPQAAAKIEVPVNGFDLIEEVASELDRSAVNTSDDNFEAKAGMAWLYVYSTNQSLASATQRLSYKHFVMKYMDETSFVAALSGSSPDDSWRCGEIFYEGSLDPWSKVELVVALDELRGQA